MGSSLTGWSAAVKMDIAAQVSNAIVYAIGEQMSHSRFI
jgi:hypothetical protein